MAKRTLKDINIQQDSKIEVDKYSDRVNDISTTGDSTLERLNIDLMTHDDAILYYMNEVIKPQIVQNGNITKVPTKIGNQEIWNSIQTDGFYRDKNEKLLVPLIVLNRDNIEIDRNFFNKMDANLPTGNYTFEKTYSKRNIYDKFSANRVPQKEFYNVTVPDYLTISYSGVIVTNYMENMNKIIESMIYASDSYWGKENSFRFKSRIDNWSNTTEYDTEGERVIKSEFTLVVNGYIVTNSFNREVKQVGKKFSVSSTKFVETVVPL